MITSDELEGFLWKYGTKQKIANLEHAIYAGGPFFDGLQPPKSIKEVCEMSTIVVSGRKVYGISAKGIGEASGTVFYLHGGGFTCGLSKIQWDLIEYLALNSLYRIVVPDYPLLPHVTYKGIYEYLLQIYRYVCQSSGRLFVLGDSAGASLVLGLSQLIDTQKLRKPDRLIAISPWMDVEMTNPEIEAIHPTDPTLDLTGLRFIVKLYAKGEPQNPLVSPIYGDYSQAAPIMLIVGTRDILYPDCKKFYELCKQRKVDLSYHEYKDMVHVFPLFDTPQGNEAKELMLRAMR